MIESSKLYELVGTGNFFAAVAGVFPPASVEFSGALAETGDVVEGRMSSTGWNGLPSVTEALLFSP